MLELYYLKYRGIPQKERKMKNWLKVLIAVMLVVTCAFTYVACDNNSETPNGGGNDPVEETPDNTPEISGDEDDETEDDTGFIEDAWQIKFHYSYTALTVNENDRTENKKEDITIATIYVPYADADKGWTDDLIAKMNAVSYHGYKFTSWYLAWDSNTQTGWNTETQPQLPVGDAYDFSTADINGDINLYAYRGDLAGDDVTWSVLFNYETDDAKINVSDDSVEVDFVVKSWTDTAGEMAGNAINEVLLSKLALNETEGWTADLLAIKNSLRYDGYHLTWFTGWNDETMDPVGEAYAFNEAPTEDITLYGVMGIRDDSYEETDKTLVSGILTLNGNGDMFNFSEANNIDVPWYNYKDSITKVVMTDGITNIGKNSFANFSLLKEIDFSDDITAISENAFYKCTSTAFKTLRLPSKVTSIGIQAFANVSLREVYFNEGLVTIETSAFTGAKSLQSVVLPTTLVNVGASAFKGASNISKVFYAGASQAEFAAKTTNVSVENENLVDIPVFYCYSAEEPENDGLYWYYYNVDGVDYPAQYSFALQYFDPSSKIAIFTDYVKVTPKMIQDTDEDGNPLTAPVYVQATDENGALLFEEDGVTPVYVQATDENGNLIFEPVMVAETDSTGVPVFEAILTEENVSNYTKLLNAEVIYSQDQDTDNYGNLLYEKDGKVYAKVDIEDTAIYVVADVLFKVSGNLVAEIKDENGEYIRVALDDERNKENVLTDYTDLTVKYLPLVDMSYGYMEITTSNLDSFEIGAKITGDKEMSCVRAKYASSSSNGVLGGGITWTFSEASGTLTITPAEGATNATWDFESTNAVQSMWTGNAKEATKITKIVIEDGITGIGSFTFSGTGVTEVVIPASVTYLSSDAFSNCMSLLSVYYMGDTIPEGVTSGGAASAKLYAKVNSAASDDGNYWYENEAAQKIAWSLDNGKLYIGGNEEMMNFATPADAPWYGAKDSITSVEFARNITALGTNILNGYSELVDVQLPTTLRTIPESALANTGIVNNTAGYNSGLLVINNHLIKVDPAIRNNKLFVLPIDIVTIADGAFSRCDKIETIYICSTLQYINPNAFISTDFKTILVDNTSSSWTSIAKDVDCSRIATYCKGYFNADSYTPNAGYCNHVFDETWEIIKPATCLEKGKMENICIFNCGISGGIVTKDIAIDSNAHAFSVVTEVPATCLSNAMTVYKQCTNCTYDKDGIEINCDAESTVEKEGTKLNHEYGKVVDEKYLVEGTEADPEYYTSCINGCGQAHETETFKPSSENTNSSAEE